MSGPPGSRRPPPAAGSGRVPAGLREKIEKILIARYAPPCLVFDRNGDIRLELGPALARLGAGEHASASLWDTVPADLAHPLQALVERAGHDPAGAVTGTIFVGAAGSRRPIPVVIQGLKAGVGGVEPLAGGPPSPADLHLLIVEDPEWPRGIGSAPVDETVGDPEESPRTETDLPPNDPHGAAPGRSAGPGDPGAQHPPPRTPTSLRRVLVVESHRDKAETMRLLLELRGYDVAVAHAREAAIEKAKQFRPGIAVCGVEMSGPLAGSELAGSFRDDPELRDVLLVAVTGPESGRGTVPAVTAGFHAHLRKPVDPAALIQLLEELPRRTWQS